MFSLTTQKHLRVFRTVFPCQSQRVKLQIEKASLESLQDFSARLNNHYSLKITFLTGRNVLRALCTELQRMSGEEHVNKFCESLLRLP